MKKNTPIVLGSLVVNGSKVLSLLDDWDGFLLSLSKLVCTPKNEANETSPNIREQPAPRRHFSSWNGCIFWGTLTALDSCSWIHCWCSNLTVEDWAPHSLNLQVWVIKIEIQPICGYWYFLWFNIVLTDGFLESEFLYIDVWCLNISFACLESSDAWFFVNMV